jgi:glycosyltransferase involved in cell wall biosynthesis
MLHVIQELETGGAERVVVTLAAGARDAGHEVAVAAAPGVLGDELGTELFDLPVVSRRPTRIPAGARALRRALRAWQPDLLHCHNPGMALVASIATLRGRAAPGLTTVHGVPDEDYRAAARVLRIAGFPVVACGPGVESGLAENGLEAETTIVNGISAPPPAAGRQELEREFGLSSGHRLVVAVGRLAAVKNQSLAIRAVALRPEASLILVGDGPLRPELDREARELGVERRVVLAGTRSDARAIVGAADAFVLTSRAEGLPLGALEALASGTPVVATAVRGVRELLADGETALLVPPGDVEALAAALERVLTDTQLAERLVKAGREVAARYTTKAMVGRYLELYEDVLSRGGRA